MYEASKGAAAENLPAEIKTIYDLIAEKIDPAAEIASLADTTGIGSLVCAVKPGDGSAREQAASCQKVLGTWANIAREYATKRYRSNCINWGILPLISDRDISKFSLNGYIYLPGIRAVIETGSEAVDAWILAEGEIRQIRLSIPDLTGKDRDILLAGNLINYQSKTPH